VRDCLAANPSKPNPFSCGCVTGAIRDAPSVHTHAGNLLPVQLALETFQARLHEKKSAPGMRHLPSSTKRLPHERSSHRRTSVPRGKRLRRASFFYRSSSKYRGSASQRALPALRNLQLFKLFIPPFKTFEKSNAQAARADIRSLPFETRSPKRVSNDHANSLPREHYRQPVMDIVDVGFYPSTLSSSLTCPVPPGQRPAAAGHENELATALQQSRLPFPFENRSSY
jgi:hypothetical protein